MTAHFLLLPVDARVAQWLRELAIQPPNGHGREPSLDEVATAVGLKLDPPLPLTTQLGSEATPTELHLRPGSVGVEVSFRGGAVGTLIRIGVRLAQSCGPQCLFEAGGTGPVVIAPGDSLEDLIGRWLEEATPHPSGRSGA